MKKILGLDLGTNSIGWAVINSLVDDEGKEKLTSISSCGSRIIPMDAATLGDFIIRKSKLPPNPERSVQFSGKRTKRSVQKIGCTQHL